MLNRRKSAAVRKRVFIQIRLSDEQKEILFSAAAKCGQDLSNWARGILLKEARLSMRNTK